MKKFLSILLLYTSSSLAQSRMEYANFIQTDTAVKWAAIYSSYADLSTVNPNFNIRNFYINKLKQQGATAYMEDSISFAVTPVRIYYAQYKEAIKPITYDAVKMNWYFDYDDNHNASEKIMNRESNTCALNNKLSFFKVKQLLYYRNNQFKIQNILISPVIYKKQAGAFKEEAEYFESSNFAFNETKDANAPIPSAAKFIGRSCNNLVLFLPDAANESGNNILTLNNWNLARLLYRDIKNKILKAYDTDKSIYPDTKNVLDYRRIETYKYAADSVMVPVFDSLGGSKGYKVIDYKINFDSIYNFTLVQDFYFDFTKEILYSKLVALAPRLPVVTSTGVYLGLTNYWGVIFPEEKKKVVKKIK
jgi:hypothetical protein